MNKLIHSDSQIDFMDMSHILYVIKNGIPLSDLTNGEVLMKMFPQIKKGDTFDNGGGLYLYLGKREFMTVPLSWWNSKWGE